MANWDDVQMEERTVKFFVRGLRGFWDLLEGEKNKIALVLVLIILSKVFELSIAYSIKLMTDQIQILAANKEITNDFIFLAVGSFLFLIFTICYNRFFLEVKFLRIIVKFENWLPIKAHEKLMELSPSYHELENTGQKISKITKGCDKLVDVMAHLYWGFIPNVFFLILNMLIILIMDWRLGLLFIIPLAPAIMVNWKGWKRTVPAWEECDKQKEKASGIFCQSILNISTVQSYVQEERERRAFSDIRTQMEEIDLNASLQFQKYFFGTAILLRVSFYLAVIVGIIMVIKGEATAGTVIYVAMTGNTTSQNLWQVISEYLQISKKLLPVMRMKELLDEDPEIKSSPDAIVPKNYQGEFEFKNVEFFYPKKENSVLDNVNLKIHPGQMIALVGKSGEGKTTIFRLVSRMYDPIAGGVFLDGTDIRKLDLKWYRRLFAIVPQEVDIFDTTILENIRYAYSDATEDQINEAVKAAHLSDLASNADRFPQGINTEVGERGVRLSGGERQRVGIARAYLALLNGAKILALDEATSSLDSQAEKAIQEMLNNLRHKKGISIIAIAHRLSTIKGADMIYVVNDGKISEKGNHSELVDQNGIYADMVKFQQLGLVA